MTVEGSVPYFSYETEKYIKASKSPACVDWKVSCNQNMSGDIASSGRAYTTSDIDYTIKVFRTRLQCANELTGIRSRPVPFPHSRHTTFNSPSATPTQPAQSAGRRLHLLRTTMSPLSASLSSHAPSSPGVISTHTVTQRARTPSTISFTLVITSTRLRSVYLAKMSVLWNQPKRL